MAREFAQIKLAIWADDDWRDLTALSRYLYLTLLTSPTLSHCGVADWRPSRLSALNGMSVEDIEDAGTELIESLHLVIDEDSEEVLIRSFVRNDGLMKQPKMATAMATAHAGVASQAIRGVIVHELIRLRNEHPTLSGWGSDRATELLGMRSVNPSTYPLGKGLVKGSGKGKPTPSTKGSPTPTPSPTPATSRLTPSAKAASAAASELFDEFWACYPRKEAKGAARKAWASATKKVEDPQAIIDAGRSHSARVAGSDPKFIPHPATWLNQERWADETVEQQQADVGGWFQPFTLPACPPEIADDPQRYEVWVEEQRRAWREASGR